MTTQSRPGFDRPHPPTGRVLLAITVVSVSSWTAARLVSKFDFHWTLSLLCGAAIGGLVRSIGATRCKLWEAIVIGMAIGGFLLLYEMLLWFAFELPPPVNL